jgi:hypothetical protein
MMADVYHPFIIIGFPYLILSSNRTLRLLIGPTILIQLASHFVSDSTEAIDAGVNEKA